MNDRTFEEIHERKLADDLKYLRGFRPDRMWLNACGWVVRVERADAGWYEVRFPWMPEPLRPEALHAYAENENGRIPIPWKFVRMIDDTIATIVADEEAQHE